jgi:hypothetical protein
MSETEQKNPGGSNRFPLSASILRGATQSIHYKCFSPADELWVIHDITWRGAVF